MSEFDCCEFKMINDCDFIIELKKQNRELVEMLLDINLRIKAGSFNIPMYESYYQHDVENLLKKCWDKK